MVNMIRRALSGFLLLPGRQAACGVVTPCALEDVIYRACALRGYHDKEQRARFLMLPGHEESTVLRRLRAVIVEGEAPPAAARAGEGLNLVIFRGVFGCGGHDLKVHSVQLQDRALAVECDFETPGDGLRTTSGFTQPVAIIPLRPLPQGRYHVRLNVRELCRGARGLHEMQPSHPYAVLRFKVKA